MTFLNKEKRISADELKRVVSYDKNTGVFTRLIKSAPNAKIGSRADIKGQGGYRIIMIDYAPHMAHRMAWLYETGAEPRELIDHINGIRDDNRFCNIRECSEYQNKWNAVRRKTNRSGFKGVDWHKASNKWRARITCNKVLIELGSFDSAELAHEAYKAAAIKHHGEFARFE